MFNPQNAIVKLSEFVSHRMSKVNCSHAWEAQQQPRLTWPVMQSYKTWWWV